MKRIAIAERAHWRARAEEAGFAFHTIDGARYWDERAYYAFSLAQIENDIEDPTAQIHAMALDLVDEVVGDRATVTNSSSDALAEISAPGVTKATGLAKVAARHGVGPEDVVVFGDMPNDIAAFEWVREGGGRAVSHNDLEALSTIFNGLQEEVDDQESRDTINLLVSVFNRGHLVKKPNATAEGAARKGLRPGDMGTDMTIADIHAFVREHGTDEATIRDLVHLFLSTPEYQLT